MAGTAKTDEEWMDQAREVAGEADCTRASVGAVIVRYGRLVSTGANRAPAGHPGCASALACPRGRFGFDVVPKGAPDNGGSSRCIAVHAEAFAIIRAGYLSAEGATLYVTHEPCWQCGKLIAGAGITRVVTPEGDWDVACHMILSPESAT